MKYKQEKNRQHRPERKESKTDKHVREEEETIEQIKYIIKPLWEWYYATTPQTHVLFKLIY